jgi:DNA topoisomerase-1
VTVAVRSCSPDRARGGRAGHQRARGEHADGAQAGRRGGDKRVADYLSNTPAVCRASYIDPRVFDRFDSGETIRASLDRIVSGSPPDKFPDRARIERAVPRLLE